MVAVTHGCVVVVLQPSCSLRAAYRRSPMTVHLVLSQSLFMCFIPLLRAQHVKPSAQQTRPRSAIDDTVPSKLLGTLHV